MVKKIFYFHFCEPDFSKTPVLGVILANFATFFFKMSFLVQNHPENKQNNFFSDTLGPGDDFYSFWDHF